ncbi:hypothetical protein [Streptomyces sp. NPDC047939]|uniref:hypothetical protein n=1 Tax=Streptomyces sp. NPDC047939 TaxID=3155381 RepID=UPI00343301F4
MTKPRFTFEEHVDVGLRLSAVRDELLHLGTRLSNAYPRSGPEAEPSQCLDEALKAVERARVELERVLNGEHPEQAQPSVYYPDSDDRLSVR